jgi:hypothetical protein
MPEAYELISTKPGVTFQHRASPTWLPALIFASLLASGDPSWAASSLPPPPPASSLGSSCSAGSDGYQCPATIDPGASFAGGLNGGLAARPGVSRFALGATGLAAAADGSRWNAWLAGSESHVAYTFQPQQSGGHVDIGLGGIDYTFGSRVIVGLAVSAERTRVDTAYNNGSLNGRGNTFAPYLSWAISRAWTLDASLGAGRTTLNSTDKGFVGGATGSTRDNRGFASLGLFYRYATGKWQFLGKGLLLTAQDHFNQYTTSNGAFVAAQTTHTMQGRIGAQAAYDMGNGVSPYFGLTYIYDIYHNAQVPVSGQTPANDRDSVQVAAGVNFSSRGPFYGGISATSEQGRTQVRNDQVLINLGWRF